MAKLPGGPVRKKKVTKDVLLQYLRDHGWKEEDLPKATPEILDHAARSMWVEVEE